MKLYSIYGLYFPFIHFHALFKIGDHNTSLLLIIIHLPILELLFALQTFTFKSDMYAHKDGE